MIPDDYKSQCDYFRELLMKIADGDMALPLPAGSINLPQSTTKGQQKIMTRTKRGVGTGTILNEDEGKSLDTV